MSFRKKHSLQSKKYDDVVDVKELEKIDNLEELIKDKPISKDKNDDIFEEGDIININGNEDSDNDENEVVLPMDRQFKVDDIIEEDVEFGEDVTTKTRKHRHHWYGVPLGAFLIIFSLIGIYSIVSMTYKSIYNSVTDDSEARSYDDFLNTVVMLDPEPFENIDGADKKMLLEASIWKTVTEILGNEELEYDEYSRMIIDVDRINTSGALLFGPSCILKHISIDTKTDEIATDNSSPEYVMAYDEENKTYHIPLLPKLGSYQPYVEKVTHKDDLVILKVNYKANLGDPNMQITSSEVDNSVSVVKSMEYTIKIDSKNNLKYITAIRSYDE